jgi:hypothetical protein
MTADATRGGQPGNVNAMRHGLRSDALVVPNLAETEADYRAHENAIVDALAPRDALEAELAARVAALTWRARRVARWDGAAIEAMSQAQVARARRFPDPDLERVSEAEEDTALAKAVLCEHRCALIARYESHLSREIGRALRELDRQRERRVLDALPIERDQAP